MATAMAGSTFFPVRLVTTRRKARASQDDAIAVLQNPSLMIHFNPLVESCVQDEKDPNLWHIGDVFKILGHPLRIKYSSRFVNVPGGINVSSTTGVGTTLNNRWRIQSASNEGEIEISEEVEVQAFRPFMSFVLSSIRQSHERLIEKLVEQLESNGAKRRRGVILESLLDGTLHDRRPEWTLCIPLFALFISNPSWGNALSCVFIFYLTGNLLGRIRDPYGKFHMRLNGSSDVQTEWLNMGYWENTSSFPLACRALAMQVISAAHCATGGTVLDVGHGCGDSLLLLLRDLQVPTPNILCGITSLQWQHWRTLQRVKGSDIGENYPAKVYLYQGDAVHRPSSSKHPLNPLSAIPGFTSIIVIDCAYHFRTKATFLRQCYERLESGGYIALADLYRDRKAKDVRLLFISIFLGTPLENFWSRDYYIQELERVGFVDCEVKDVSDIVFSGFRSYLRSRKGVWSLVEKVGIGMFVECGGKYAIVSARKP